MSCKRRSAILFLLAVGLIASSSVVAQAPQQNNNIADVLAYIDHTWDVLTRSPLDCKTVIDVRVPEHSLLYLPADYPEPKSVKDLETKCKIAVKQLPERITSLGSLDMSTAKQQGVLYLPNSYVVPGGFFNEMYGWDSYFIMVVCCGLAVSSWRAAWSKTSSSRSNTTAAF